jgi:hypothetical protein
MVTDPERLLNKPSSRVALLLLQAGKEERPSPAVLRRGAQAAAASAALGLSTLSAGAAAGSSAPAGTALGLGALAKWLGIGALGGIIAAPVLHRVTSEPAKRAAPTALSAEAPRASRSGASTLLAPDAVEFVPRGDASESEARENGRNVPRGAPAPATEAESRAAALLAAEVELVERGRAALARGGFDEALRMLAPYEERFPKQQLLTEVLFLRMEARSRSGDDAGARSLAQRILVRGVAGPQAARARAVLAR